MAHICNAIPPDAEAEKAQQVQGQPGLYSKFKTHLGYSVKPNQNLNDLNKHSQQMVKQAMRNINQVKGIERDGHSRVGDQTRADASQADLHLQVRARTT